MSVDEALLALLWLKVHDERRARERVDWAVLGRLNAKELVTDPTGRAQSVVQTDERLRQS